ncbi:MAG TPA: hypothetical protein VGC06_32540 [Actinomycetes bacterium]
MKVTGKTRVGLLAVVLVGLLAGSAYVFLGRAQGLPVVNEQPLAQTEHFRNAGNRFEPPPAATATAKLTATDAYKAYLADAVPPGLDKETSQPPVVSLATYTSELGENAGIAPTLVWLIKFSDIPVVEFGPDLNKGSVTASGLKCPFYVIIDAATGQRLESFQTCDSPTTS